MEHYFYILGVDFPSNARTPDIRTEKDRTAEGSVVDSRTAWVLIRGLFTFWLYDHWQISQPLGASFS